MICERCHKRMATLKYTEVVKGKARLRNICGECMGQLGEDPSLGFELTGAPAARIPVQGTAYFRAEELMKDQRECRGCAMPLEQTITTGRVGCADCYTSFRDPLDAVIRAIHFSPEHRGKTPPSAGPEADARTRCREELRTKRALLRSALKLENFEEAAVLRDEIQNLEVELGASTVGQN